MTGIHPRLRLQGTARLVGLVLAVVSGLAGGGALAATGSGTSSGTSSGTGSGAGASAGDGSGSRLVGSFQAWEVRIVGRPGTPAVCMARSGGDDRFVALYAPAPDRLRLQFFSDRWSFGEGGRIVLSVAVDGGEPWALADATAFRQSALFDLPQTRAGADFLKAMMRGSGLTLIDAAGNRVGRYNLAGSASAIGALAACVRGL